MTHHTKSSCTRGRLRGWAERRKASPKCNKNLRMSLHHPGHQGIQPKRDESVEKQASLGVLLMELHVYNLGGNGLKLKCQSKKKKKKRWFNAGFIMVSQ